MEGDAGYPEKMREGQVGWGEGVVVPAPTIIGRLLWSVQKLHRRQLVARVWCAWIWDGGRYLGVTRNSVLITAERTSRNQQRLSGSDWSVLGSP